MYLGTLLKICRGLGVKPAEIIDVRMPSYYHYSDFDIVENSSSLESKSVLTREELKLKQKHDEKALNNLLEKYNR